MSNDLERGYAKGIEQYPVYSPTVKLPEREDTLQNIENIMKRIESSLEQVIERLDALTQEE